LISSRSGRDRALPEFLPTDAEFQATKSDDGNDERKAQLRAGLSAEREASVLAAWKARSGAAG
jgi:hypothetical protein